MNNLRDIINNSNSRMMVVWFVKADGTHRIMYCKKGIQRFKKQTHKYSYIKQARNKANFIAKRVRASNPNIINVWDCESKGYRSFKLDSVISLSCGNKKWSNG